MKAAHKSLFEQTLLDMEIGYTRIRIATLRHNGRVERQHGLDEKRFYKRNKFYSLPDAWKKVTDYNKYSNSRIKICLNFKSPDSVVADYLAVMF